MRLSILRNVFARLVSFPMSLLDDVRGKPNDSFLFTSPAILGGSYKFKLHVSANVSLRYIGCGREVREISFYFYFLKNTRKYDQAPS